MAETARELADRLHELVTVHIEGDRHATYERATALFADVPAPLVAALAADLAVWLIHDAGHLPPGSPDAVLWWQRSLARRARWVSR